MENREVNFSEKTKEKVLKFIHKEGRPFKKHIQKHGVDFYSLNAILDELITKGLVSEIKLGIYNAYELTPKGVDFVKNTKVQHEEKKKV